MTGAVVLLSAGWGGRVSDKQISIDSDFFDKISMGDCILADRGFTFKKELSGKEVDTSRQLSNVRIHVEKVIRQVKKFSMLQNIVPITQIDLLDDIMVIVCAIINLNKSIVSTQRTFPIFF